MIVKRLRPVLFGCELLAASIAGGGAIGILTRTASTNPVPAALQSIGLGSWALIAVLMLVFLALPMACAAYWLYRNSKYALPAAIVAGGVMAAWVLIQFVFVTDYRSLVQALFGVLGGLVAVCGIAGVIDQRHHSGWRP